MFRSVRGIFRRAGRQCLVVCACAAGVMAAPMTPKVPRAEAGNGKVVVQWRYDGGGTVDGFRVKRSTAPTGPFSTVASTSGSSATDNSVTNGTRYYYVVVAHLNGSESSPSPVVWAIPRSSYEIAVDCGTARGTLPRYERYHTAIAPMGSSAVGDLMTSVGVEYVRNMSHCDGWITDPTRAYNEIIHRWNAEAVLCLYRPTDKNKVYQALKSVKKSYPSYRYIEVDNEPEIATSLSSGYITVARYMQQYRAVVEGVALFHADPAFSATPRMKIGGPCVAGCQPGKYLWSEGPQYPTGQDYLFAVLDSIHKARLPLDFVTWHSYGEPVSDLKRQADDVKAKLASLNRDTATVVITEWSGEKGGVGTLDPSPQSLARVASYQAAGFYQWLEAGVEMPMTWAISNTGNWLKTEMIPGNDGKVMPLYNVSAAYRKMRTTRVSCTSNGINSDGSGPGGIASFDGSGVTVFLWNHDSPDQSTTVSVRIANVPFASSPTLNVKQYLIDEATSNWAANSARDKLQMVADQSIAGSATITLPLTMKPQSVCLIEIVPDGGQVNTYRLTVQNGTGSGDYAAGQTVAIAANSPTPGQVFDTWTGSTVADRSSSSTTIIMPAAATTVTATYRPRPAADTVRCRVAGATTAPVIDGQVDPVWTDSDVYSCAKVLAGTAPSSPSDFGVSYAALWDTQALYLLTTVVDDKRQDATGYNANLADNVEVYLDGGNDKASLYGQDDFLYRFVWNSTAATEDKHHVITGVVWAQQPTTDGYRMEIAIPWSSMSVSPTAGTMMGFDLAVTDNDGAGRETKLSWHAVIDSAWVRPSFLGEAVLEPPRATHSAQPSASSARTAGSVSILRGSSRVDLRTRVFDRTLVLFDTRGVQVARVNLGDRSTVVLEDGAPGMYFARITGKEHRVFSLMLP